MPNPLGNARCRVAGRWARLAVVACLASAGCTDAPTSVPEARAGKTGRGIPSNWVTTPRPYSQGLHLASMAGTPSRLLATTLGPAPSKLISFTEDGMAQPFSPHFTAPEDMPCFIELSPGVGGGFQQGDVLVSRGAELWLFAPGGEAATQLWELPQEDGAIAGLCFDTAGGFSYELLLLATSGAVHRVDPSGRARRVGTFGTPGGRGPGIAPARFTAFGGRLLVAFPEQSEVRSMTPGGDVGTAFQWSGVSGVCVLPDDPRAYGSTGNALFVGTANDGVFGYPHADLAGRGGQIVLTSMHRSGSGILIPEGGGYTWRAFSRWMGAEVVAACARRPAVTHIALDIEPASTNNSIPYGSAALLPVALLSSIGFLPSVVQGGDIVLAGARPVTRGRTWLSNASDLNGDGVLDLILHFRPSEMLLDARTTTLVLEGTTLAGERLRGTDRVLVLAP